MPPQLRLAGGADQIVPPLAGLGLELMRRDAEPCVVRRRPVDALGDAQQVFGIAHRGEEEAVVRVGVERDEGVADGERARLGLGDIRLGGDEVTDPDLTEPEIVDLVLAAATDGVAQRDALLEEAESASEVIVVVAPDCPRR